ncbi:MAG: helicase [Blastocatellia bacterium]|nr:helicase [Blastocatellia bacterium]
MILKAPSSYEIRKELIDLIRKDLLGPAGEETEEIAENRVNERYLVGILAPKFRDYEEESNDEDSLASEEESEEAAIEQEQTRSYSMFPSSLGMTFCVSGKAKAIEIAAGWGQYNREKSETIKTESGAAKGVWKRKQIRNKSPEIKLVEGKIKKWIVCEEIPDVYTEGIIRKLEDSWLVSLFLVNGQREESKETKDAKWMFQVELSVTSANPLEPDIFIQRNSRTYKDEPEALAMEMLYRDHRQFVVGHGVGVTAEVCESNPEAAIRLSISPMPSYEVAKTVPPTKADVPELETLVLDMKKLGETLDFEAALHALPTAYEAWIESQRSQIDKLAEYRDVAELSLKNCEVTLVRIREGIELLKRDEKAASAFAFMNRAMWLQRIRSIVAEKNRQGSPVKLEEVDIEKNRSWYPFQLAFILINLAAITDLEHPDRSSSEQAKADLLWFPTGGGKTEAYLGVTAYTLAIRRLQGVIEGRSGEYGVAVLMRYTLRLLTLQQFQRAAALICACEFIRREAVKAGDERWGNEPFRIGLWVGRNTTPNTTAQSKEFIDKKNEQKFSGASGSPEQLTYCPWCGAEIKLKAITEIERTFFFCSDSLGECLFTERNSENEGIPAIVVDDEIYRRLPALLIATVDKFAQMPWKGQVQMLFGQVNKRCERHGFRSPEIKDSDSHKKTGQYRAAKSYKHPPLRPPDLIIQDELHLISGPLGSLVGLYETAVDKLSSWQYKGKEVRPKVIASTATIKQARKQVVSLFLRKAEVFPPQGLDASDNFFARQKPPDENFPGRVYVGICAPGRRLKIALIRAYVALLSSSSLLYEKYQAAADPWMTLVGYFNTLRELGGMRRLIDDDIKSRLLFMDKRGLARRKSLITEELTSRRNSTDIPVILDKMEAKFDSVLDINPDKEEDLREEGEEKKELKKKGQRAIDILLATNMLSVGVDIKRLGAMVVAGQPKNTAEYIQATSRVGRSFPGVVFTVYNWAKPRDLSHYEKFEHYHATFYKQVEAISITPFSVGAIYRGLSSLLVSLIRLSNPEFNENSKAENLEKTHLLIMSAKKTIADRAEIIGGVKVSEKVNNSLQKKLDYWESQVNNCRNSGTQLGYESVRDGRTTGLLKEPTGKDWEEFTSLRSLRNVEPSVNLILHKSLIEADSLADLEPMECEE